MNKNFYISQSGYLVHIDTVGEQSLASDNNKVSWRTGLLDKNGREIYKGDIVECQNKKWEVKFKLGGWFLWNEGKNINDKSESWYLFTAQDKEILGNIYQNPELLA